MAWVLVAASSNCTRDRIYSPARMAMRTAISSTTTAVAMMVGLPSSIAAWPEATSESGLMKMADCHIEELNGRNVSRICPQTPTSVAATMARMMRCLPRRLAISDVSAISISIGS